MKILIVCRERSGKVAPFVVEQVESLERRGAIVTWLTVKSGGVSGYLDLYHRLHRIVRDEHFDVIHAHYGLCALVAVLQRRVPVVSTFPGSDINIPSVKFFSRIAVRFSSYCLFMSDAHRKLFGRFLDKTAVLRYGTDLSVFRKMSRQEARRRLGWTEDGKTVLFCSRFSRQDKCPELAKESVALCGDIRLMELTGGYTREEMCCLYNAVDAMLMTSRSEGSPQSVKEALACSCPVVSVDVGDVRALVGGLPGCRVTGRNPREIADNLQAVIDSGVRPDADAVFKKYKLGMDDVADTLMGIYARVARYNTI